MTKDIKDVEKQIENAKGSKWKGPFHGTALVITDLTGETENGWMLHGHTGRRSVEGPVVRAVWPEPGAAPARAPAGWRAHEARDPGAGC